MATLISDLDGTVVYSGTYRFLPGALPALHRMLSDGHDLLFITGRGDHAALRRMLDGVSLQDARLITDVPNPRVLLDDGQDLFIQHRFEAPWDKGRSYEKAMEIQDRHSEKYFSGK